MRTTTEAKAYDDGKVQQALIIAAKPDWTRRQWRGAAEVLEEDLATAQARVAHLRGRLDVLDAHIIYAKLPEKG